MTIRAMLVGYRRGLRAVKRAGWDFQLSISNFSILNRELSRTIGKSAIGNWKSEISKQR
jgi:hypothetical protein